MPPTKENYKKYVDKVINCFTVLDYEKKLINGRLLNCFKLECICNNIIFLPVYEITLRNRYSCGCTSVNFLKKQSKLNQIILNKLANLKKGYANKISKEFLVKPAIFLDYIKEIYHTQHQDQANILNFNFRIRRINTKANFEKGNIILDFVFLDDNLPKEEPKIPLKTIHVKQVKEVKKEIKINSLSDDIKAYKLLLKKKYPNHDMRRINNLCMYKFGFYGQKFIQAEKGDFDNVG